MFCVDNWEKKKKEEEMKKRQMCEKHNIPMNKRRVVKEGQSRYFCVKCETSEKNKKEYY